MTETTYPIAAVVARAITCAPSPAPRCHEGHGGSQGSRLAALPFLMMTIQRTEP
jgi:hypothetical protein